jgi:hypothetical protein
MNTPKPARGSRTILQGLMLLALIGIILTIGLNYLR